MKKYIELLELNYNEAVIFLLEKYGEAKEDYFKENSYENFLNNKIENITIGKASRTNEGLYCHHIKENKYENMSNGKFIKAQNIPFEYQKKEHLVYCDLVEHTILHGIISKETNLKYGKSGLDILIGLINQWYIENLKPTRQWMINCYEKSYINKEDAIYLIETIEKYLQL